MLVGICATAPQAHFLVGEGNDADGAVGALWQVVDQLAGRHGNSYACTVIDGAGARVPRVEMATDGDNLVGVLLAGDLADHVGTGVTAIEAHIEIELDADRPAISKNALELVGVGIGQRGGRNGVFRIGEPGNTGVRRAAMFVRAGRAQQVAGGHELGCDHRPLRAHGRAHAIVVAVLLAVHAIADIDNLALDRRRAGVLECIQAIELDHFGGQATLGRAGRVAQRDQRQRLRERRNERVMFAWDLPQRVGDRLRNGLVEAQFLELGNRPFASTLIGRATGKARADFGGQGFDDLVAGVVGHRLVAQLGSRLHGACGDDGIRRGGTGRASSQQQAGGKQTQTKTAHGEPLGGNVDYRAVGFGRLGRKSWVGRETSGACLLVSHSWAICRYFCCCLSRSRISVNSTTSAAGGAATSSRRVTRLMNLTTRKIANAMIRNWIRVLMKAPYCTATSATLCAGLLLSAGRITHFRSEKSMPPVIQPIGGMMIWSTSEVTILPNAPPITTPTARSMTLPRMAKVLNSCSMPMCFPSLLVGQRERL